MFTLRLATALLCSALLPTAHAAKTNDGSAAKHGPIVVLITLDGMPARTLNDPRLPMPTLRMLESQGAHADSMLAINPMVTWPNHTTLITGVNATEHHVLANGLLTFPPDSLTASVKPWTPKPQLVHAETLYDALAKKGMTTGQVDWVAIYGADHVQWAFAEAPDADGPIARDLIASGVATRDQIANYGEGSSPAWRDQIWTDAAADILEHHTPNLLLFHLLQTDTLQHEYGALSNAAYAAYAYADTRIQQVVDAAKRAGVLDRTTFIITADHGFSTYMYAISLNAGLRQMGLGQPGTIWTKAEGGLGYVYLRDTSQLPKVKQFFSTLPGVAAVYTSAEAQQFGLPAPASTDQAPSLYIAARPDYAFDDDEDNANTQVVQEVGTRGAHGYLNSNPEMQAIFVMSGAHVKPGVDLGSITNLQVAPTVASLLGVKLPAAKAPVLKDALR